MAAQSCPTPQDISEEQTVYASVLEKGMYVGLLILPITFILYVFGIMKSAVPVAELSKYWSKNFHEYQEIINQTYLHLPHPPIGWGWLSLLSYSDYLNFVGVAILAGVTIICYGAVLPIFLKKGEKVYAVIAVLEILVLGLAASGLLKVGGH
jgi:ABC-type transport system involved in multi-copper enzyme maturation permease subunit